MEPERLIIFLGLLFFFIFVLIIIFSVKKLQNIFFVSVVYFVVTILQIIAGVDNYIMKIKKLFTLHFEKLTFFKIAQAVFVFLFLSVMLYSSYEEINDNGGTLNYSMTVATGIVLFLCASALGVAISNKVKMFICVLFLFFGSKAQEVEKKEKTEFTVGVMLIPELSLQEKKIEAAIFPSIVVGMFTKKTNQYIGFNILDQNLEYTFDWKLQKNFMFSVFLSKKIKSDPEKLIHTQNPNFISLGFAKGLKTFEKSRFIGDISIFVEMRNHFNQDWYPVAGLIIHPQYELKFKKRKNAPPN